MSKLFKCLNLLVDTDTCMPSLNGPTSECFHPFRLLYLASSHLLSINGTCQNATFPVRSSQMDSKGRALDTESIILILNHPPASQTLDDLIPSPFTILIFSFLILKVG